jgi:hypothetical protein
VGLYLLFFGQDALDHAERYFNYRLGHFGREWPRDTDGSHPFEGLEVDLNAPNEEWNLYDIRILVEERLNEKEGAGYVKGTTYALYRFESLWSSHPGYGPFTK